MREVLTSATTAFLERNRSISVLKSSEDHHPSTSLGEFDSSGKSEWKEAGIKGRYSKISPPFDKDPAWFLYLMAYQSIFYIKAILVEEQ